MNVCNFRLGVWPDFVWDWCRRRAFQGRPEPYLFIITDGIGRLPSISFRFVIVFNRRVSWTAKTILFVYRSDAFIIHALFVQYEFGSSDKILGSASNAPYVHVTVYRRGIYYVARVCLCENVDPWSFFNLYRRPAQDRKSIISSDNTVRWYSGRVSCCHNRK